jgi:hypothetical protein
MRVAILSEFSADEAALRVLVDAVLAVKTLPITNFPLQSRGYNTVRGALAAIIRFLHYRTDADGLVVVVDSNHTTLEELAERNRLRELREMADGVRARLGSVVGRIPLRVAIGVASPAIEAWLLCRRHLEISEAAWEQGLRNKQEPYSKLELKRRLYGVEFASLQLMTEKMMESARELTSDLVRVERKFPKGFGTMAEQLRDWRRLGR